MLTYIFLILCVNIDALSYGIAYGLQKKVFNFFYILAVALLSTALFAVPLYFSKYIFQYFDRTVCYIVNAVILISLGVFFIIPKKNKSEINKSYLKNYGYIGFKKAKNIQKIESKFPNNSLKCIKIFDNATMCCENLDVRFAKYKDRIEVNAKFFKKRSGKSAVKNKIVKYFYETIAISVDAIFTAFLSGFSDNFYLFLVFFYLFSNFFAIFFGNIIFFKINKKCNVKLDILSGIIFILLGIFKIFGF